MNYFKYGRGIIVTQKNCAPSQLLGMLFPLGSAKRYNNFLGRYTALVVTLLSALYLLFTPTVVSATGDSTHPQAKPQLVDSTSVDLNQLIIGVEPGTTAEEIVALLSNRGLKLVKYWPDFAGALVELDTAPTDTSRNAEELQTSALDAQQAFTRLEQTRQSLEQIPNLSYVTYNARITAANVSQAPLVADALNEPPTPPMAQPLPNDPQFTNQWALNIIRVVDSWNISQGDPNVVIAVIDSGYNITHPDLENTSLWTNPIENAGKPGVDDDYNGFIDDIHGWDWIENDNVTNDTFGHGTHVGGTIAATTGNQLGISGIGRNLKVLPLRILDGQGSGYIDNLVDALSYAKAKGVRIVNLSLVLQFDSPILSAAIDEVGDDMMIVAATGNVSANVYWPAAYGKTIAVAATDDEDKYASFSNRGPQVDLAAPGVDILSADDGVDYVDNTGTSMATPHVSALAGLISSLRPDFSNAEILNIIKDSSIDINIGEHRGRDDFIGHGRVDVYQSLLNASAGLQLQQVDPFDEFTFANRGPLEYNIRVQTPETATRASKLVRGAVVHYKLIPIDATLSQDLGVSGHVLTNSDGTADITFLAPIDTGSYMLRTQVGQESVDFPLKVYPTVEEIELNIVSPELEVGTGETYLSVKAFNSTGDLMSEPIPIQLLVDSGTFVNGQNTLNVVINNGVYTTTYYAATEIGTATVEARITSNLSDTESISLRSGPPSKIEFTSDIPVIQTAQGAATARLTVRAYDAYGNPVDSVYVVNLTTSVGEVSQRVFSSSVDGSVTAILTVPPETAEKAVVWANLPSFNLLAKLKIDITNTHYVMLPLAITGQ